MRKELVGAGRATLVVRFRQRLNKWSNITHDGQLTARKQWMNRCQARMQPEFRADAFRHDWEKTFLCNCKTCDASDRSVGGITCRIQRNDRIIPIVPASEKNTN